MRYLFIFIVFFGKNYLLSAVWTDGDTDLMWEIKTDTNVMKEYNWNEANNYCDNLILNGYDDWWLPSTTQLKTIANRELYGEYNANWSKWFLKNEKNKNGNFFIKDKLKYNIGAKSSEEQAWFIDFESGYDDFSYTNAIHYVRCVRSSKLIIKNR